jgi:hypothetical protein
VNGERNGKLELHISATRNRVSTGSVTQREWKAIRVGIKTKRAEQPATKQQNAGNRTQTYGANKVLRKINKWEMVMFPCMRVHLEHKSNTTESKNK